MKLFILLCILLLTLLVTACEKVVDLDYRGNQSKIIIDGNITDKDGPYFVKITRSIPLTETGSYPGIDNAMVAIADDAGNKEVLVMQGGGVYKTVLIEGVEGRTYTLTVQIEDQTYTAQSTMPRHVAFDSVKVDEIKVAGDIERNLIPIYKDPIEFGNNYRFVLTVNDKRINQHLVQNDDVKNGLVNTFKLEINDDDLKLKSGDVVDVEMECIDKNVALFYTTLALISDSGPGGGTTPSDAPGNISNGALGLFSAHTTETRKVSIP